jgi:hypothetical protein
LNSAPQSPDSTVSEDFGAKTAYLEAIAMRTAVSRPKSRSGSRGRAGRSSVSSAGSSSSQHSEKWKAFLERKRAASPAASRVGGNSDVSKAAAEQYASQQVEAMMAKMSSRSKSNPREYRASRDVDNYHMIPGADINGSTVGAAEDLAAARVEAMMAALSSADLMEEGEI